MIHFKRQYVAYKTIIFSEFRRIIRIWPQTVLPPAITSTLYFVIFGHVIGSRIGEMAGHQYIQFIAPGLIMMNVITSSYASTASSLFSAKFQRSIEEILVSPIADITFLLAYMSNGMLRGFIVGSVVSVIAILFTHLHVYSFIAIIISALFSSAIFSLFGVINAIYAKTFDDISIIPTFILTPLTYLGGVFYAVSLLPKVWQYVSYANPIFYIVDNFRYGFFGAAVLHQSVGISFLLMILICMLCFFVSFWLVKKGVGLRG